MSFQCDQEIQPLLHNEEPHPCGWACGAEDYDEPRYCYGKAYCPRCGFILPDANQSLLEVEKRECVE